MLSGRTGNIGRGGDGAQEALAERLPVAIERTRERAVFLEPLRIGLRAVDVDRKRGVARLGQHVGAAFLVVGHAVPVMDDQNGAAALALGHRDVALEGHPADLVGHVIARILRGQGGGAQGQCGAGGEDRLSRLHARSPCQLVRRET
jgi:hypothetical protein